jgi:hypothetical protein
METCIGKMKLNINTITNAHETTIMLKAMA